MLNFVLKKDIQSPMAEKDYIAACLSATSLNPVFGALIFLPQFTSFWKSDGAPDPGIPEKTTSQGGGLSHAFSDGHNDDLPSYKADRVARLPMLLACPFIKHDPVRWSTDCTCGRRGWEKAHEVRQHLTRHHKAHHCPRCNQPFGSQSELWSHIRASELCTLNLNDRYDHSRQGDSPVLDDTWITEATCSRLKDACREGREAAQWVQIYNILFPNEPAPSPYWRDAYMMAGPPPIASGKGSGLIFDQDSQGWTDNTHCQNANTVIQPAQGNDAEPGENTNSDISTASNETEAEASNPSPNETSHLPLSDISSALDRVDSRIWDRERARELPTNALIHEITSTVTEWLSKSHRSGSGIRTRPSEEHTQGRSNHSSSADQRANNSANLDAGSQPSKRKRRGDEDVPGDESREGREEGGSGPSKRSSLQADPDRQFACPFLKMHPLAYRKWKCCLGSWPTTARLKYVDPYIPPSRDTILMARAREHLYRRYLKPTHCPRCFQILDNIAAVSEHLRQEIACDVQTGKATAPVDGIDVEQEKLLRSKQKFGRKSEFDRCMFIYKTIWPKIPEKEFPSPYWNAFRLAETVPLEADSQVNTLANHLLQELPKLLTSVLEREYATSDHVPKDRVIQIVQDLHATLCDRFQSQITQEKKSILEIPDNHSSENGPEIVDNVYHAEVVEDACPADNFSTDFSGWLVSGDPPPLLPLLDPFWPKMPEFEE